MEIEKEELKEICNCIVEAVRDRCGECSHLHGDFTGEYRCRVKDGSCPVQRWRRIVDKTKRYRYA